MSKKKKKKLMEQLTESEEKKPVSNPVQPGNGSRPIRWDLVIIFVTITIGGLYLAVMMRPTKVPQYTYDLLAKYPHDPEAFTQGFAYEQGSIWESTGRYGESSMRKVDLETGKILKKVPLDDEFFGEGCVRWEDKIFQLTWKEEVIFEYDLDLNLVKTHQTEGHKWGITSDGRSLIISDGGSILRFHDPNTFKEINSIVVRDDRGRIGSLNELEFIDGKIYANRWNWETIYEIDPESGIVTAVIDLTGLWPKRERPSEGVMNGIAFNSKTGKLLVTGKLCPFIYEIELKRK